MPKNRKNSEFKRQWTKLSREFRLKIPYCEKCGKTEHLLVHHIFPRKFYSELSLEPRNLIVLCPKCHNFCKNSAHKDGMAFVIWLMKNKPEQFEWAMTIVKSD